MTKATDGALGELHGAMAEAMAEMLKTPDKLTASDLNVIRQFLKDNGINSDGPNDEKLQSLSDDLPDDLDNVTPLYGG